ncbi:hypothetical protein [Campylobacter suis]|uniref:Uncharacterized protein n=1 Tax=Campylobacter suis TaxID=2790657 RepID=A0ABN7KAY1_9BACT|nr:hypothetical protein [Campylobacter suis]CAD7289034.1 hypothetical protein LMG8286_01619 [Campylobacter suis]
MGQILSLDYKLFSSRDKRIYTKNANKSKLVKSEYVVDSVINTYALALFANEFYPIEYDKIPKDAFEKIFCVGKNFKKYEKAVDELCEECGKKSQTYITNLTNLRCFIKDFYADDRNKNKHIKGRLEKLNERYFLLKLPQNRSKTPQSINDKNSYILSPNSFLQKQVKIVKNFSATSDEVFGFLQDCAFIMIDLYHGEFAWDEMINVSNKFIKLPHIKKPLDTDIAMSYIINGDFSTDTDMRNASRFLRGANAVIVDSDGVTLVDNDGLGHSLGFVGSAIFELEIFKQKWISFRQGEALVIFSPHYFRIRSHDGLYEKILKIKRGECLERLALGRIWDLLNHRDLDPLNLDEVVKILIQNNALLSQEFCKEIGLIKNNLSYKRYKQDPSCLHKRWLIGDIYHLYKCTHLESGEISHKNDCEKAAKLYFENLLNQSLEEFIKSKKSS